MNQPGDTKKKLNQGRSQSTHLNDDKQGGSAKTHGRIQSTGATGNSYANKTIHGTSSNPTIPTSSALNGSDGFKNQITPSQHKRRMSPKLTGQIIINSNNTVSQGNQPGPVVPGSAGRAKSSG